MTAGGRALVTGATGFVGANLVRRLLADGHRVDAVGRAGGDRWRLEAIRSDITFHEGDLADAGWTRAMAERARPDWIFHLAAYGAYPRQDRLGDAVRTNVVGTSNLVEAGLRVGFAAFVNAGSSSEYGLKDHAPAEQEWVDPNSHYAATKAAATLLCREVALAGGAPLVTLRLYSVYGAFEEPGRLIPAIVLEGLNGRLPPLANPDTARDFIHVDDCVDALVVAAEAAGAHPGAVFNLGTGAQTTLREVVATARLVFGMEAEPAWGSMADRGWDTTVWISDSRLLESRLGWRYSVGFEAGLRLTGDWFRTHPELREVYARRLG